MSFSKINLGNMCEKIEQNFDYPCYYTIDPRTNDITFNLHTSNGECNYTVSEYKLDLLGDTIVDFVITSFEHQLKYGKAFIVRILPFEREIREDKQLIFEDVLGIATGDYPKIEIQKASDPIKVTMIVPEGYYLVEDRCTHDDIKEE